MWAPASSLAVLLPPTTPPRPVPACSHLLPPNLPLGMLSSFKLQLKFIFSETPSLPFCLQCSPLLPTLSPTYSCPSMWHNLLFCINSFILWFIDHLSHQGRSYVYFINQQAPPPDSKCFITSRGLSQPPDLGSVTLGKFLAFSGP